MSKKPPTSRRSTHVHAKYIIIYNNLNAKSITDNKLICKTTRFLTATLNYVLDKSIFADQLKDVHVKPVY